LIGNASADDSRDEDVRGKPFDQPIDHVWIGFHINLGRRIRAPSPRSPDRGRRSRTPFHAFRRPFRQSFDGGNRRGSLAPQADKSYFQWELSGYAACTRSLSHYSAVATSSYNCGMETGIRELKDNLSRYIRRIEAGERIVVTAHGRVVAELVPPGAVSRGQRSELDRLVACGAITPPAEDGDPLEGCPEIRLPRGTATALIDTDRGEA
jgi:prevent-host-death family protein